MQWWTSPHKSKYAPLQKDDTDLYELGYPPHVQSRLPRGALWALRGTLILGVFLLVGSIAGLRLRLEVNNEPKSSVAAIPNGVESIFIDSPRSFELRRSPRLMTDWNSSAILRAQEDAFDVFRRPKTGCDISPWHEARYASLRPSSRSKSILLALNLRNSEGILANMLLRLPELLRFLGPSNVYISIYESGSDDEHTQDLLMSLAEVLNAIGAPFTIISRGQSEQLNFEFDHRIESLALLRNKLLEPLFDESISNNMPAGRFDEVLLINDIIWCAADVLEVLYQKRQTGAHQSCSVDWDWNMRVVYDRWVLRALSGRTWYDRQELIDYWHDERSIDEKPAPLVLFSDPQDRQRFESLQPVQVFSCWNGMSAISASAFVEKKIGFRVAHSDRNGDGTPKEPTDIASECYLLSVDLWKSGMGKIVLASRARVAYDEDDYARYRTDLKIGYMSDLPSLIASEEFKWVKEPPHKVAMQDLGWWEELDRWAPWDEA